MEILRNAIYYIESLECLLSDSEREERAWRGEEGGREEREEEGGVTSLAPTQLRPREGEWRSGGGRRRVAPASHY